MVAYLDPRTREQARALAAAAEARAQCINEYASAIVDNVDKWGAPNVLTRHRTDALSIEYTRVKQQLTEALTGIPVGRGNESHWNPAAAQVERSLRDHRSNDERILNRQIRQLSPKAKYWSTLDEQDVRDEAEELSRLYAKSPDQFLTIVGELSEVSHADRDARLRTIRRRIRRQARMYREAVALTARVVKHGGEQYISTGTLYNRRQQLEAQRQWAEASQMVDTATAKRLPMLKLADISGENRLAEMVTINAGLEALAERRGYGAIFVTLTAPPEFHPNPSHGSDKWNGSNPREGHDFIRKLWQRIRARHAKRDTDWLFLRTAEPHRDSAAHWHLMIWATASELKAITADIKDLFDWSDSAAKIKEWDAQGAARASSYLMKYLQKATQREGKPDVSADRVDAWRSTYGIRSIQIGGVPRSARTLWRMTRALTNEQLEESPWLAEAAIAARCGDFAAFVEQLEAEPIRPTRQTVYLPQADDTAEPVPVGTVITGIVRESTGEWCQRVRGQWEIETDTKRLQLFIITQGVGDQPAPEPLDWSDFDPKEGVSPLPNQRKT